MRVCLIKTSSMGDVLHALPALTDAKRIYPDLEITWVVEENFAEIPHWHDAVNEVIPIALRRWRKSPFSTQTKKAWQTYRTLLQKQHYDAVIDGQGLIKSALFATRLAQGIKHGYDRHSIREPIASFFYNKKYAISYQQHAVERIRQLFAQSLGYTVPQTQGDYGIAPHFVDEQSAVESVIFFHGTTRADKFWQDCAWRKLAEKLTALGLTVRLPWSNDSELKRAEWIAQRLPKVEILPKSTLTELARYIGQASAVVSVDTGLAHLTAALNKPNVTLYGATDPKLVGTYGKNQYIIQAENMAAISVEQVWQLLNIDRFLLKK